MDRHDRERRWATVAMITRFAIPPFIVTLAMMLVGSGLAYILAKGQSIYQIPDSFIWLGRGADLFSLPNAVVLMLVLYALAHVLMSRMTLGRYLYAVGGNDEAARLSGVPVKKILLFAYTACGALAGLGGITHNTGSHLEFVTARQHSFSTFAVGSLQNCGFPGVIYQKDADVIEAKALANKICSNREKFIQIL